jgi:hypothetical protein
MLGKYYNIKISNRAIFTSNVPVLKLEVDPRISMETEEPGFFDYYPL